ETNSVRRRRRFRTWLILLAALGVLGYFGYRWLVTLVYPLPLEHRATLYRRAEEHGLDPYLVAAVIRAESGWEPTAESSQGARGLMQLMPDTARWVADQMGVAYAPERLNDPDYNIRLGCWYLANLHQEFGGDTVLALAAYNGGRSNVQKWLRDRQWTGEHHTLEQIPFQETRLYVAKVLRDLERYHRIYAP
ncbi:MAG TPA: lytic transglycosylase domain-containing protein, partial [Symbiobacteriaceae bacterium]|nr:lytic transglycosylase domain-containing protein [Symbiobacteriaceae bacterium]